MSIWGEPLPRIADFFAAPGVLRLPPPMDGSGVVPLAFGRQAIALALRALALRSLSGLVKKVAVPDYICEEVPRAIRREGWEVVYYRIRDDYKPDIDSLSAAVKDGASVVVVVHYFGFPVELGDIVLLCRQSGVLLVEDCAHCFGTVAKGNPVGTVGAFAFFSFRKFLPVPDGACLVVNDPELRNTIAPLAAGLASASGHTGWTIRQWLRITKTNRLFPLLHGGLSLYRKIRGDGFSSNSNDPPVLQQPSRTSMRIAPRHPSDKLIAQRRDNFIALSRAIGSITGARPIFASLPESGAPLFLPVRMADARSISRKMACMGVTTMPWPTLPEEIRASEGVARKLSDTTLGLPIHGQACPAVIARCLAKALA